MEILHPEQERMKTSDLLVKCLEKEQVQWMFGVPGEENLDLLDSLSRSTIRFVPTRHEQGAGFMAATLGRLTGKAGVCLSTLGPGATNLMTAAAYAQLGAMPMLMITGQKPIRQAGQGQFQKLDIVDMMGPVTKYSEQLVSGHGVPASVREAIRLAEEERPGAVHIELPEDIASEDVDAEWLPAGDVRRPVAEEKSIRRCLELLEDSRHPLLVIAAGANRKRTANQLRRFVDQTGIPFITTQMGKGVVDECHPLFLGNAALSEGDFMHRAIEHADLILNVGHDLMEKPPFIMHKGIRQVVHINFSAARVDPVYFPQTEVVGDIANTIWQLLEAVTVPDHWDFSFFDQTREALDRHIAGASGLDDFPLRPERLVADVRTAMPEQGVIALDNGIYKIWFARNYRARCPNTVLLDNALATMGAGLPSAMAACLVNPDTPVVAICGDGGFMMNSQELETAVRLKLNLVVLVLTDGGYGMIKWKQDHMGFESFGLDFHNPDFVAYANAYGAEGHRLDRCGQLSGLIRSVVDKGGVHLVDVPVDYSANDRILNHEIKRLSEMLEPSH